MTQDTHDHAKDGLWPSPAYYQQLEQLRAAVGKPVFLAEINSTAINAGVKLSDETVVLLAVVDFPQPDPYRQLCPHMLILDDGRGVNLGRIARVSLHQAFGPDEANVLYQDQGFVQQVLFAPRVLSRASLAETSRALLANMFGDTPGRLLESAGKEAAGQLEQQEPDGNEKMRLL